MYSKFLVSYFCVPLRSNSAEELLTIYKIENRHKKSRQGKGIAVRDELHKKKQKAGMVNGARLDSNILRVMLSNRVHYKQLNQHRLQNGAVLTVVYLKGQKTLAIRWNLAKVTK